MKRKAVLEFLSNTHPGDAYDAADIQSSTVRDFWMSHSDVRDLDVKTYLGVHALFEVLIDVLDEHLEVEFSGEIETSQSIASAGDQEDWLALRQEAGRIKFLFPKQIEQSALFTDANQSAWRLRESAAWAACWGPVQTRLRDEMSDAAYQEAWQAARDWDFPAKTLSSLSRKMREVLLAVLHILISGQKTGALALAYLFEPETVRSTVLDEVDPSQISEDDILELQENQFRWLCQSPDATLVSLRQRAERAWKNIRREGFHADDLNDPEYLEHVDLLSSRFIGALRFLERLEGEWQRCQPSYSDMQNVKSMFDRTFKKIYRPVSGEEGLI
ncbi:MAG: hypothetical protein AAFW60_08450, partial [Pseudomonadota bacterium]